MISPKAMAVVNASRTRNGANRSRSRKEGQPGAAVSSGALIGAVIGASTSMTSINVARAALRGPSPSSTSAATTAPSTAQTSAATSSARTDRPRPLDDLDDRVGSLLQNPPLHLTQRRLPRARDVALIPRNQLLAGLRTRIVTDEQIHQHVDCRLGAATPPRQRGHPLAQLLRFERADVLDGLDDQIVEGGEVVGRGRQRQTGPARNGAMTHCVEPAFAQQLGSRADERILPAYSLGSHRCRHA